MKKIRLKRGWLVLLGIAIVLFVASLFVLPSMMLPRLQGLLASAGLGNVAIGGSHIGFAGAEFTDIKFDADGFSTADAIKFPVGFGQPHAVIVDGLKLTGQMDDDGTTTIDGIDTGKFAVPGSLHTIILNHAQLDLTTNAGSIRLEARGQLTTDGDGTRHILAVVGGSQNQLLFDSRWMGEWKQDGSFKADGTVGDLRLKLDHIAITRGSGKLSFASPSGKLGDLTMNGKFVAGMTVLDALAIHAATLEVTGPVKGFSLSLQGTVAQYDQAQMHFSETGVRADPRVNVTVSAPDVTKLAEIFGKLQKGFGLNPALGIDLDGLAEPGAITAAIGKPKAQSAELILSGKAMDPTAILRTKSGNEAWQIHAVPKR